MKGWQSNAVKDACFQRVRYTGKPANMPCGLKVIGDHGIEVTFTDPLERLTASDAGSYGIEQWNYVWSGAYGSPDVSVLDPKQQKRDTLEVKSAKLSDDGKTVTLDIPGLRPVMQMKIGINVDTADGKELKWEIYNTVNRVGNKRLVVKTDGVQVVDVPPPAPPPAPAPVTKPTTAPTAAPTTAPTTQPTTVPSTRPSTSPSTAPSTRPTTAPTTAPSTRPTTAPTTQPTTAPTTGPTTRPTTAPTTHPATQPTTAPAPPAK
jgi:hypothetical protein